MTRGRRVLSAACGALAAATCLRRGAFVPGPVRDRVAPLAAASAAAAFGSPALSDEIGDAAKKLAADSYAFAKEVDWNSGLYLQAPGKFQRRERRDLAGRLGGRERALGRVIASVPEST